jgi:hypothetical protein
MKEKRIIDIHNKNREKTTFFNIEGELTGMGYQKREISDDCCSYFNDKVTVHYPKEVKEVTLNDFFCQLKFKAKALDFKIIRNKAKLSTKEQQFKSLINAGQDGSTLDIKKIDGKKVIRANLRALINFSKKIDFKGK